MRLDGFGGGGDGVIIVFWVIDGFVGVIGLVIGVKGFSGVLGFGWCLEVNEGVFLGIVGVL